MKRVFLGIGGNIGDVRETIASSIAEIKSITGVTNVVSSRFFQTSPVSDIPQDDFINAVIQLDTSLDPVVLFSFLEDIERAFGKLPKPKNRERIIDIDILLFGDIVMQDPNLTIPHLEWDKRLFVLIPMLDLVQEVFIPGNKGELISLHSRIVALQRNSSDTVILVE